VVGGAAVVVTVDRVVLVVAGWVVVPGRVVAVGGVVAGGVVVAGAVVGAGLLVLPAAVGRRAAPQADAISTSPKAPSAAMRRRCGKWAGVIDWELW
jgi:hypothetical protein